MSKPYDQTRAAVLVEYKSLRTKGEFEAVVSVFGNVDHGGDRVAPSAFDKTLAKWGESGDPIPIIWNHMWDDPFAHIGVADPNDVVASEKLGGLHVKRGVLDGDKPFAGQVGFLLERRSVREFSFGYNLLDSERAKDGALDLLDLDLFEFGPTLKGMNPATELLAVKALADVTAADATAIASGIDYRIDVNVPAGMTGPDIRAAVEQYERINGSAWRDKAGARHSKDTLAKLTRLRDELDELIAAGSPADEPAPDDAKALGTASDPDADLMAEILLIKGQLK